EKDENLILATNNNLIVEDDSKPESPVKDFFNQLRKNRFAMIGIIIIIFFVLLGLFAPLLTPYGYKEQVLSDRLLPPSSEHLFGTDNLGRDIFTRIAYGARLSLQIGFFAVSGALFFGTLLGLIAGFYGRWIDMVISRIFDILLAFPSILLAISVVVVFFWGLIVVVISCLFYFLLAFPSILLAFSVVAILGASLQNALIAIAIVNVPIFGRLVRSQVISLREEEFVMAARAQGLKNG